MWLWLHVYAIIRWFIPWGRLNIDMPSYQYRDYHYKDKTVMRPSYLYNGNLHTWKDGLNFEIGAWCFLSHWPWCVDVSIMFPVKQFESHYNVVNFLGNTPDRHPITHPGLLLLRPKQNCCHFGDNIFKFIFLNENVRISLRFHWSLFLRVWLTILQHWFR